MSNYKTGDKFIIELGEQVGDLWKIKGFRALVFDENGLKKLSQFVQDEDEYSRTKGQEEAWELFKKMRHCMKTNDTEEAFEIAIPYGWNHVGYINEYYTYEEAHAKVEAWEKKKNAPKLTPKERAFCEVIQSGYIARDEDGQISWYGFEPCKEHTAWIGPNWNALKENEFPFIKWEDEKPWSIEDLLKLEVAND